MYELLDEDGEIQPVPVGIINFQLEQSALNTTGRTASDQDKQQATEKFDEAITSERLTSADYDTAITIFNGIPKDHEIKKSQRRRIKNSLRERRNQLKEAEIENHIKHLERESMRIAQRASFFVSSAPGIVLTYLGISMDRPITAICGAVSSVGAITIGAMLRKPKNNKK